MSAAHRRLGATPLPDGSCHFRLWAPWHDHVEVSLQSEPARRVPMARGEHGYHRVEIPDVPTGSRYFYRLSNGRDLPDPASRSQPDGVHGASEVVDLELAWKDAAWRNPSLHDYVLYELHVGTFSRDGTFDGVVPQLRRLRELGITAIELMPVAQFPGMRNWGYDGVYPFAVQASYGGARGLQRLVQACHDEGLAVVLDVVYNHLGPEGNYLGELGPYFTDKYHTPWGLALSFDGAGSDAVRRYFIDNALQWIEDFHIDGLRLDAVHAIFDQSARPFLEELAEEAHASASRRGRHVHLIAESDLNDPRLVRSPQLGGYGLDGMWSDDFHHAVHALLTGERGGYYVDFGDASHLARAWQHRFTYDGRYSPHRDRTHGRPADDVAPERIVVCTQNHDQVGNRMLGERLGELVGLEGQKLAMGALLLSPYVPLIFMGEEWGERAPFQYFTSHGDEGLVDAVRKGRKEEFASFAWQGEPPDPQASATFVRSRPDETLRDQSPHRELYALCKALLALRNELPRAPVESLAFDDSRTLFVRQGSSRGMWCLVFHFGEHATTLRLPFPPGRWYLQLDSAAEHWGGPGSRVQELLESPGSVEQPLPARGFLVFRREPASDR